MGESNLLQWLTFNRENFLKLTQVVFYQVTYFVLHICGCGQCQEALIGELFQKIELPLTGLRYHTHAGDEKNSYNDNSTTPCY